MMLKAITSLLIISILSMGTTTTEKEVSKEQVTTKVEIEVVEQDTHNTLQPEVKIEEVEETTQETTQEITKEVKSYNKINLGDKFTFRQGVMSEEVRQLRHFLNELGYKVDTTLYSYDTALIGVIKEYQSSRGLEIDGNVGPNTLERINKEIEEKGIIIPELEIKIKEGINIPSGNWLLLNKTNNTIYYMKGKEVLEKYHIATGSTPGKTPEGKFTIVIKSVNPYWGGAGKYAPIRGGDPKNPLGPRWMGLSIRGGGTYGIHGNADFSSIGKYASMGCVRMYNDEVKVLYDKVPNGTVVWLGSKVKLQEYGIEVDWVNN